MLQTCSEELKNRIRREVYVPHENLRLDLAIMIPTMNAAQLQVVRDMFNIANAVGSVNDAIQTLLRAFDEREVHDIFMGLHNVSSIINRFNRFNRFHFISFNFISFIPHSFIHS